MLYVNTLMHKVNKNNQTYNRIEHAGHKSKSRQQVKPYFTSCTLFLLFVQQTCQNSTECMDRLFHKITEWYIKYIEGKKQLKNCFNLPTNV